MVDGNVRREKAPDFRRNSALERAGSTRRHRDDGGGNEAVGAIGAEVSLGGSAGMRATRDGVAEKPAPSRWPRSWR
jgi:hypothetical protein